MKILEYKTCLSSDVMRLDFQVNDLIRKGWQPYGSPCTSLDQEEAGAPIQSYLLQAMVKVEGEGK